ncbi:putative lipid II flippase FtsW [Youngiibacter fragilis]|uniref:Probable peptidoglycan glycosyltransferase FtsW n=1 Tax=Youngiibacter fragilis 232.1 TaxID=994573 RepID=V7I864_9CLOT|nr:putative lipid II flippase FtsW [Youngiibacter fragilis]ETA82068.1 stage V sporulation protein E [Youngiibacter fragilis 232.1]
MEHKMRKEVTLSNRNGSPEVKHASRTAASLCEADFYMVAAVTALVVFGLLMVYSASSYDNIVNGGSSYSDVMKQGLYAAIGIVMMLLVSNMDYHMYNRRRTWYMFLVSVVLCLLVVLFPARNNAQRWIYLPFFSFQPSEIAKYAVVLYLANLLKHADDRRRHPGKQIIRAFLAAGIVSGIIVTIQSNLSIGAIIGLTAATMVIVSGYTLWKAMIPAVLGIGGLAAGMLLVPYRMRRFTSFLDPFADPTGDGHQLVQSLFALASGGLFGRGLSMSRLKAYWIPEAHNDFIFAVVAEELGLIGALVLLALIALLIFRGIRIALNAKDRLGFLMASGITVVLALQSMINIAVVIGAFPVTGVTLPFISAGGTSLILNLTAAGILLNISRHGKIGKSRM